MCPSLLSLFLWKCRLFHVCYVGLSVDAYFGRCPRVYTLRTSVSLCLLLTFVFYLLVILLVTLSDLSSGLRLMRVDVVTSNMSMYSFSCSPWQS